MFTTTTLRLSFRRLTRVSALALTAFVLTTNAAQAQLSYSIEFQGPTIGMPSSNFPPAPIGAGDLLAPGAGTPWIRISGGALGIAPSATTGEPEMDAMSYGNDPWIDCNGSPHLLLSVDEFAVGSPGAPMPPNVTTEGAIGNQEASADIYMSNALPAPPVCNAIASSNTGLADGNGVAPFAAPGLTLIEPNPPTFGAAADPGDNLDALVCAQFTGQVFFSLDAATADPFEGPLVHSGTAQANGVSPGAVLVSNAGGGGFSVFAPYFALGLSFTDDINALLLRENGNGVYDRSDAPLDWLNGQTDMLLFSVTRNSPIVGTLDAIHAQPVEPGDILTPTVAGVGILIPAEALGLWTNRTNGISPLVVPGMVNIYGDNLDALALKACGQMGGGDPA